MELFAHLSWNIVFCDGNELIEDRKSLLNIQYTLFAIKIIMIIIKDRMAAVVKSLP